MRSTLRELSVRTLRGDPISEEGAGAWAGGGKRAHRGSFTVAGRSTIAAAPRGKAQTWHGRGVALLPLEAVDRKVLMMAPSPKGVLGEGGTTRGGVLGEGSWARS